MENIFRPEYRELSAEEKELCDKIKEIAMELHRFIDSVEINEVANNEKEINRSKVVNRCIAVSKTKLEESVMWAIKGLTT